MSDKSPPLPSPSPSFPGHDGKLTPSSFLITSTYLKAKLAQAEEQMKLMVEEAARSAARSENNGKPVISPKLTPWFLVGFILCGSVISVVVGDPDVPAWVVKVASIGSLFFGGALGIGPGWRK